MDWSLITSVVAHAVDAVPSFAAVLAVLVLARQVVLRTTRF